MIKQHPYRAVGIVLAWMAVNGFVAGMIGQYNDGPWGGLPEWLGMATWIAFLAGALTILVLSAYLAAAAVAYRKDGHRPATG